MNGMRYLSICECDSDHGYSPFPFFPIFSLFKELLIDDFLIPTKYELH